MELKLEVVLSSSIKRKKPWPRFCWLGQEKESVFLLDDKRISEIDMVSGRTKKRTPKLHPLLNTVVTMVSSPNGLWLCGLLVSGELFLWNRDKDLLKTAAAAPEVVKIITAVQGNATQLSLQVSGDGMRVLLVVITGQVFLWECKDVSFLMGVRDGPVEGQWAHIQPMEDTILPSSQHKEASQHTLFIKTEAVGDACLSALVFTSEKKLIITCLKIQWEEGHKRVGSVGYNIQWATKTYPMSCLIPPCQKVKSRGALVPAFSPDGQLLAIVLNQRQPKATQVLFVSTQNFVSISSSLGGCGSKKIGIPSKYIRSYWVGSLSWSPDSLFLACVLKRGSLLMLARLGGLLTLTSSGCNIDFGPAHFLPLHPLVTFRPTVSGGKGEASLSSSSLSVQDVLRQRYSVTWHPHHLFLIVSDGYMATVMRVRDRPSPAILLKTILKDVSRDLKKASQMLDKSQIHVREWLESVSGLNFDSSIEMLNSNVICRPKTVDSVISASTDGSTLPLFLRNQGTLGDTNELLKKAQTFFEDDSDLDGPPCGSHVADGGRLEFASMFDTLNALDTHTDKGLVTGPEDEKDFETDRKTSLLHCELGKIQSKLLTAWAFGMSLGNAVEHRACLLNHTLQCVVHLAALLHLIPISMVHTEKNDTFTNILHLLKALLTFLPWDSTPSDRPRCLGLVVELSIRLVRLLLTPRPESQSSGQCQLTSQTLSAAVFILQLVSDSLDQTYSLHQKDLWSSVENESYSQPLQLSTSDIHYVPQLQNENEERPRLLEQAQRFPQRPSSRLFGVWQWVYDITQQYVEELKAFQYCDGWDEEQQQLSVIISQIQKALQAAGERLDEGPALLSYPGEHLYLCGLYPKSADAWRLQICEENNKSCDRSVFQETRLCLALLYSLLSQYRLKEAQELGDHMACLILHRAGDQSDKITANSLPCPWLPMDLHSDAACAVVQTLGRFMASYFTNQPLYILPPHNVAVLPPLHLPHAPSVGRLVPLCQQEVSRAIREQHLSEVWTVDYAQDLLLLGGLLPETVWLAYHLGDWKTAVSLSLAYTTYCTNYFNFTRLKRRDLHLPNVLEPESIFQAELECLLSYKSDSQEHLNKDGCKNFKDPLEEEDLDLLQLSIQDILKASVMAGVNVMSSPLSSLLNTAKDMCSCLPMLVPSGLYLPSPPLYCPQPSPNTQDPLGTPEQFAEITSRHKVSRVLQRLLLLLRSARSCYPAAQWYIRHLRQARHLLHKIKKKYSYPSSTEEEKLFPEGLMKFATGSGFFRRGLNEDGHLDPDIIQTIICFRELCGLCWMLHVREQLSISCRIYQSARQHGRDEQILSNSEVRAACVDALYWVCRFLPFARFLSAEEFLQDILLSLVSELPPICLVAEMLVRAFPEEEDSVRVPLREKYNSLLQRLRQCSVLEGEKEEVNELMMLILIQDKYRQRRKHLGRLQRHLAPPELHLWEKEEEEEYKGSRHGVAMLKQLSSLSTSTLTDCGLPPVCSDGDTDAISPKPHSKPITSKKTKKAHTKKPAKKTAVKTESIIQKEMHSGEQFSLPIVGTWEFELEDEEYLNFLELFLSYVLEKNSVDGGDSGSELPLLKGFSSQLKERELHSLTFDLLTTVHRRQRDGHRSVKKDWSNDPPVFRAGSCYKPIKQATTPEPQTSSVLSEGPISNTCLSVNSLSSKQKGLFSPRQKNSVHLTQGMKGSGSGTETSTNWNTVAMGNPSEQWVFRSSTSVEAVIELQQGLNPKLDAQFPELGRLLEWMIRWADRRMVLGHHGKMKKERAGRIGSTADEGVVIRVKISAPAVLTSLSLLENRYIALLGIDSDSSQIQVPEAQWTLAPVLQPLVARKLERESSVDTGYPGSAITGLDHSLQQGELSIGSPIGEPEELTFHRKHFHSIQDQQTFDIQMRQSSSQQPSLYDINVTPEKEGKSTESEGQEVSSSVSHGNISTPGMSLKLSDLDILENAEDVSSSISHHSHSGSIHAPPHPEPKACPSVQPEVSVHADLSHSTGVVLPSTPTDPPSLHPQTSTEGAATAVPLSPSQPLPTETPPMRQRLGEDLFRLVQNINYMSLMEVLGASFSNLQLARQSSSLIPSTMSFSHPNVPSSHAASFPPPNALPLQTTISVTPQTQAHNPEFSHPPVCVFADKSAVQISGKTTPTGCHHQSAAIGACVNYQNMQPLSVQAESPDIQFRESKKFIPSFQGLLTTTNISHTIPTAPVVMTSNCNIQKDPAPQILGLKLLQLYHPPLAQHSTPQYPSAHEPPTLLTENPVILESYRQNLKHSHQVTSKRPVDEKRNGSSPPPRLLSYNVTQDLTPRNSYSQNQTSETFQRQEFHTFPPVLPSHTAAPTQSLRLLHFQPVPHRHIIFHKLPEPSSSKPSTFVAAPMGETPMIKLLHIESGPKMYLSLSQIFPQAVPSNQMAHLMSTEGSTGLVRRQNAEDTRLQLLGVDLPIERTRAFTSPLSNSSKRQKRREEKEKREKAGQTKKKEITFRPNESIIPAQEPTDELRNEEPAAAEQITPGHNNAIEPGSFYSSLTGQRLLDKAMSTSAELSVYASTCKRPPECHDAFTNTDPACPATLVDKAVSVSLIAAQSPGNFQVCNEHPVQDIETQKEPDRILDLCGRNFISVLDLEGKERHQDLPPSVSPGVLDTPSNHPFLPTSAQLHVLATSVIRSAADDPQPSVTITDNLLKPITHPDIPETSQPLSQIEANGEPERVTPQGMDEIADSGIYQAIKGESGGPHKASSTVSTAWFSSRLSELDAQLAGLQNIADYLEMDFSNSKMLVNTIEKLTPVLASDVKNPTTVKKTVRLSVPQEAWAPQPDASTELKFSEKEEENQDEYAHESEALATKRKPSYHYSISSYRNRAAPFYHTPPNKNDQFNEASGLSNVWADENLNQTGLSETTEILDNLVKEGYLSSADLDLSTSQTAHHSRLDQQQSTWMSQTYVLPEDERRELRTWMRRKQRERLAVYQKHRENLREKEHKPFSTSGTMKSTNKNQTTIWRTREKKEDRFKLLEQYNQRTHEACSLINDFPTTPRTLRSSSQTGSAPLPSSTRSTSAPPAGRVYSVTANDKRSLRSQSGKTQPILRPWTAEVEGQPLEVHHMKLGLHRPVTFLPIEHLSQVTRRGMLTDNEGHKKQHTPIQREKRHTGYQRKTGLNNTLSGGPAVGRGFQREQLSMEEKEEGKVLELTSEMNRLLGLEESESKTVLAGLLKEQDDGTRADVSGVEWLDNLSECTSSSLSKIDWAAIERMVAAEED
ncbi:ciliogenesis and planar polarity effector 1 isoform X3 [Channa argus]|uniref:ciliogenesis and planar polarity effector 1 isoform X3 n=1 Tax=Channa argus TaxID=215402 RepID=UPI0035216E24